jgi:hypothetical protein
MKKTIEKKTITQEGGGLSSLDKFWIEVARSLTKEAPIAIEEASKQIISIASVLQVVYFSAITISDLKGTFSNLSPGTQWVFLFLFLAPILFWVISLWLAILVFMPNTYTTNLNSPELSEDVYIAVIKYKHKKLRQSYIALTSGFFPLIVTIIAYFFT